MPSCVPVLREECGRGATAAVHRMDLGPFSVAAMISRDNQPWLNKLWDYMVNFRLKDFDYYDNSIKMINMIILSGNYWTP